MNKELIIQNHTTSSIEFDDLQEFENVLVKFPTKLLFRQGEAIDSLCVQYGEQKLSLHGTNDGGHPMTFRLPPATYITKIRGVTKSYWNDTFILSLYFTTNTGQEFGLSDHATSRYGQGTPFEYRLPENMAVKCFFGAFSHPYEGEQPVKNKLLLSSLGIYYDSII